MNPRLERDGYEVHANVLATADRERIVAAFADHVGGRAGARFGLVLAPIAELARSASVRALVEPHLGGDAFAFRATLFDKTAHGNWPVAFHQDRFVAVRERIDTEGFARWSRKDGACHVEPPRAVLDSIVAVRVDVDGSGPANGGLQVLPGSHRDGVLPADRIARLQRQLRPRCPEVVAGGALCMRPLLVHGSRRTVAVGHRRIVHLEFAAVALPGGLAFAHRVEPVE